MIEFLDYTKTIEDEKIFKMRQQAAWLYSTYFSSIDKIIQTTIEIVHDRIFPSTARTIQDRVHPILLFRVRISDFQSDMYLGIPFRYQYSKY